jgi:hypothetical protein
MTDHEPRSNAIRLMLDWIAAGLGIGTVLGLVNLSVGVLSSFWLAYQLYVAIRYELPVKRMKLEAARRGRIDSTQPADLE